MKIFYQINKLEEKKAYFYNEDKKEISEDELPKDILKVPMGFPEAVLFYPPLKGKIYAYVLDSKGRKQYFYTKEHKEKMGDKKYKHFPKIIPKVEKLLNSCKNKNDQICQSIIMMSECNFRIGHEKYKKLYNTNGTLTLNHSHLEKNNKNNIHIKFIGKKKEENYCLVEPSSPVYKMANNSLQKKQPLFKDVNYKNVYSYLKKFDLKPKDVRQYNANLLFYNNIRSQKIDDKPKKYLKKILELTAVKMNHSPTVCKKEYLMPLWFDAENLEKTQLYAKNHSFKDTIAYLSK